MKGATTYIDIQNNLDIQLCVVYSVYVTIVQHFAPFVKKD